MNNKCRVICFDENSSMWFGLQKNSLECNQIKLYGWDYIESKFLGCERNIATFRTQCHPSFSLIAVELFPIICHFSLIVYNLNAQHEHIKTSKHQLELMFQYSKCVCLSCSHASTVGIPSCICSIWYLYSHDVYILCTIKIHPVCKNVVLCIY